MNSGKNKFISQIVIICIIALSIAISLYKSDEYAHSMCRNENCKVCELVEIGKFILNGLNKNIAEHSGMAFLTLVFLTLKLIFKESEIRAKTSVELKDRMDC